MITSYSFDKEVYVDNLRYIWLWLLVILFDKEIYVDNLKIPNYDY